MKNTATAAKTTTCCDSPELMVTGGIVRCVACFTWMPEHKDSSPSDPNLLADNQWR